MICFKDKSFCDKKDCKHFNSCQDAANEITFYKAKKWWGSDEAPVCINSGDWGCFENAQAEKK